MADVAWVEAVWSLRSAFEQDKRARLLAVHSEAGRGVRHADGCWPFALWTFATSPRGPDGNQELCNWRQTNAKSSAALTLMAAPASISRSNSAAGKTEVRAPHT